jgi:amino acid transporter
MDTVRSIASTIVLAALILASAGLAVYGAERLTQATLGIGLIGLGVLFAVIARIVQAADHHAEFRQLLVSRPSAEPPDSGPGTPAK